MARRGLKLCLLGAVVAFGLGCGISEPGSPAPATSSSAPPARVVLVGFDGLDWVLLDRLIAEGRCPTLARMKRVGAWAELVSHEPVLSPLIWTSIATGRRPEDHGILDFVVRDPGSGADVPISNRFRRVHAFWNLLSDEGRRVHVVNWWATHPAEEVAGLMVTERPFYQLFGLGDGRVEASDVWPPKRRDEVAARLVDASLLGAADLAPFVALPESEIARRLAAAAAAEDPLADPLHHLRTILATTDGVFAVGRWLLEDGPFDLLALYVEGTDTVGHRFAHYLPPRLPWVDGGGFAAFQDTMARYYEHCDRQLAELMAAAPADVTWIVTADHGFHTGSARPAAPPDDFAVGAAQWHRMVGVFLAAGPGVRPGKLPHADVYDLCRTLLWLGGGLISDELEGRELTELMTAQWAAAHPPRRVASYAGRPMPWRERGPQTASAVDAARLAELAALGYVDDAAAPVAGGAGVDKATEAFNRARLARDRGDLEAADVAYREAIERDPRFFYAMLELSMLARRAGDDEQALYWMVRAMQTDDPRLPDRLPVGFVQLARAAGRLEPALRVLDAMPARWRQRAAYHAALGVAAADRGDAGAALAAFERALEIDPVDLDALEGLLRLAAEGGSTGWQPRLEIAFRSVRTDLTRLRRLGALCLKYGQYAAAGQCFDEVLGSDPTDADTLRELARVQQVQGELDAAVATMARSLELEPSDPDAWRLHARLLTDAGRPAEAAAAEARALSLEEATR